MPTLAYCATLNHYSASDVAELKNPRPDVEYMIVGHEVRANGTPHLQIHFQLKKQVKMTTIKKWGGPWERMHCEPSRGSDDDNYAYCSKDGLFWELGARKTMPGKGTRSDLLQLKKDIDAGLPYDTVCDTHFEAALKYH